MDNIIKPTSLNHPSLFAQLRELREADMATNDPPAYHTVVDPRAALTGPTNNHFTADDVDPDEEDIPEITINAATQVRGHGNVVAIQQMDVRKIAELVVSVLRGEMPNADGSTAAPTPAINDPVQRGTIWKPWPRINIVVNCGATIVGDRNIVGPGLSDVSRQLQQPRNANNAAASASPDSSASSSAVGNLGGPNQGTPSGQGSTPPPTRTLGESVEGRGKKRKAGEDAEGASEVKRPNI